ncbi:hypothetical protein PsorP6_008521 [Peronosclerospora sorghi]|uniref:Uncharacterized protein n=1 Tax=Peronosclerospora sorghi TaxID=230839 RepID=A0ACC0WA03_9STRA|nr:hypothetical protein PsorP6_008521 [Peronosclerospora sorghi]
MMRTRIKASTPLKKPLLVDPEISLSAPSGRESGYLSGGDAPRPKMMQRVASLESIAPELKKINVVDSEQGLVMNLQQKKALTPARSYRHSRKRMRQAFHKPHLFQKECVFSGSERAGLERNIVSDDDDFASILELRSVQC